MSGGGSRPVDGRVAAARAVAAALAGQGFAAAQLAARREQLAPREAALSLELAQGALRHLLTIEHVLPRVAAYDRRRTPHAVRAVLATAAYQVVWLDRVPIYAAVDAAVDAARAVAGGRASAMVNAVLRRLAAAIAERRASWVRLDPRQVRVNWEQACVFDRPVLPPPEPDGKRWSAHLAAATGERPTRFAALVERWGAAAAEAVAWASQACPPLVLQRNPLRATPEAFAAEVRALAGAAAEFVGDAAVLPAGLPVLESPLFTEGRAYVQDHTAHAAALAVQASPGERILDLCAAPGGKTAALAGAMGNRGTVVACDRDGARLERVRKNIARLGLQNVEVRLIPADEVGLVADPDTAAARPDLGQFDAVLVDVPCSNTGVLARRPEARLGLTARKLASLIRLQERLLGRAAACVRPGGRLVYSTCSLEPEENEGVVAAFLATCAGWRLDAAELTRPTWGPRLADWRDGGYWARLIRG